MTENPKWLDDKIQFPRLISEIHFIGLTPTQYGALCGAMDLTLEQLDQLFDRALAKWEKAKMKSKKSTSKNNMAVCVLCGAEKSIPKRSILPDGWVFSHPDGNGIVEPVCSGCDLPGGKDDRTGQ